MLQLALQCGYFHSRPVFTFFTILDFTDVVHSQVCNVLKTYHFKYGFTVFNQICGLCSRLNRIRVMTQASRF